MKLLWGPDLHMNTVHVKDVVRAIWHVTDKTETIGQSYNLVDEGDSTQGTISSIISEIFNINHDYWGVTLSTLAKVIIYFQQNFHLFFYFIFSFFYSYFIFVFIILIFISSIFLNVFFFIFCIYCLLKLNI